MSGEGKFIDNLMNGDIVVEGDIAYKGSLTPGKNKLTVDFFQSHPVVSSKDGLAADVADGSENIFATGQNVFEGHIITTGGDATIPAPRLVAGGLDISLDAVDNAGVEISTGILSSNKTFTIGTDPAFFVEVKFAIADVSDTDDCAVGFRKKADYVKAIDDYTDMAALNVISGSIYIETILNNAATTSTDTTDTWVDTATHTLRINVSSAGVVTYLIDGRPPTVTAAFTFDSGDEVIPFFYLLHAAASTAGVVLKEWKSGYQ